jgi:glycine C-acetyltransferase/8-amino-7-oxononanoate synthase
MKSLESASGAEIMLNGRKIINFAASAYLGIAREPALIQAGIEALNRYGARALMPPYFGVVTQPHTDVETEAAEFFGTPAAIYLSSGYLIGLTVLSGLRDRFDLVVLDETGHYNLRDAAYATQAAVETFRHFDCDSLESVLRSARKHHRRAIVAVDGVCPAFGTVPRLDVYAAIATKYNALLFIDESHSFGTLGVSGRGAAEQCGLAPLDALRGGSLGKAFCAAGAIVVGSAEHIEALRNAPCVRGTSAGMVAGAAMGAVSLRLVRTRPELLARLRENASRLKMGLKALGIPLQDTLAPLATFVSGSASEMSDLKQQLLAQGFFVLHMQYTGTGVEGVIRCSVFADHTSEHIDGLLESLRRLL